MSFFDFEPEPHAHHDDNVSMEGDEKGKILISKSAKKLSIQSKMLFSDIAGK